VTFSLTLLIFLEEMAGMKSSLSKRLQMSTSPIGRSHRSYAIDPSTEGALGLLDWKSSTSRMLANEQDRALRKNRASHDLPSEFVKLREIAADRCQWRA
jgi:hypothetical protein